MSEMSQYRPIGLIEVVSRVYYLRCERTIAVLTEEEDTMIHHLSIAARDPKHSAEVLAEIMGGKAVPFVDFSPSLTGGSPIYGQGNSLADRNFVALTLRRTF